MYKRMLRAVVATAFSAALAYGALAVGGDIGWDSTPAGSTAQGAQGPESGDISWDVAPKDIGWDVTSAGSGRVTASADPSA
ncbi:5'-nucleotidase [Streptomyces sp. NPDC002018]|uniref:5'-nucleotidase n=1 Tax=Streptomyces sp. NPDC002018 TaxID=3364629 RepID=UPI00369AD8F3